MTPPPRGKSRLPLVLLAIVVLGGGAAFLFWPRGGGVPSVNPTTWTIPDPTTPDMQEPVADAIRAARDDVRAQIASAARWGHLGAVLDAHSLYADAAICYGHARELAPNEFSYTYLLGILTDLRGGSSDESISLLREAAALQSSYPPVHVRLGDVLSRAGRWDDARQAYQKAVDLDDSYPIARRGLGQALLNLNRAADAVPHLEAVMAAVPDDRAAHVALAQAYRRLGRADEARELASRAGELEERLGYRDSIREEIADLAVSSEIALERGINFLRIGDAERAIAAFSIVERVRPRDAAVHRRLSTAHLLAGNFEEADRRARLAISIDPNEAEAYVTLGAIEFQREQFNAADRHIRQALSIRPNSPDGRAFKGMILVRQNQHAAALPEFEMAIANGSLTELAYRHWGDALVRTGTPEGFRNAIQRGPRDPEAHFRFGLALETLGQTADAIRLYETAVSIDPSHHAQRRLRVLRQAQSQ